MVTRVESQSATWTVQDAVHGELRFPAFVRAIVDTPQFQRLRSLKQLGVGSKVFPSATHTRFEHCIGVCHLVDKFVRILEKNSNVQISDIHRKCVMLAGLLHDLGHGPFSHMWEAFVHSGSDKEWTHEQSSCWMARELFSANNIKLSSEMYEHLYAEELICALITGSEKKLATLLTPDTMFLAEIVNNKAYKIDVDKWDYLLRDKFYLGGAAHSNADFVHMFEHARIVRDEACITHIGFREIDYHRVVDLFDTRTRFHINCYQHPTNLGLEKLLIDALIEAEECGFHLKGSKISEAHLLPSVYLHLDDGVVNMIQTDESTKLSSAQNLLKRIVQRELYQCLHVSSTPCDIEALNRQFSSSRDEFFQVHKKIPHASVMAPRDVPLYNERCELVKNPDIVNRVMDTLSEKGYFEQYLVFCKNTSASVINNARKYLQQTD